MTRTREESLAYARGYNTGSSGAWPKHRPPMPPDSIVGPMASAARALRDAVDFELATLSADDDIVLRLGPAVDLYDEATGRMGAWLRTPTEGDETK